MSSQATLSFDSSQFWKEQDHEQSARLHLQHWIWQYQLQYALHSKIDVANRKTVKIADVAAGNGAWILKVARSLNATQVELLGLDITSANFSNDAWLPGNISFAVWDAYSELPAEYEGAFDVVHLRAMYSTVVDNKVERLLANCLTMLKPGGFLQWDESGASTLACHTPANDVKATACKQIIALQEISVRNFSKMRPDWMHNLSTTLKEKGCVVTAHDEHEPDRRLARAWADHILLVWRSMVALMPEQEIPLPPGMGLPEKLSKAQFAELLKEAMEETKQGVMHGMKYYVHVAKKA